MNEKCGHSKRRDPRAHALVSKLKLPTAEPYRSSLHSIPGQTCPMAHNMMQQARQLLHVELLR